MFTKINSCGLWGIDGFMVTVEAHLSNGLPRVSLVGLPDASVKESMERVHSALVSCGFSFPARHITINLAPADIRKEGPIYDLPILLTLLCADGFLNYEKLESCAFLGEVSLDGHIRPVRGCLPMTITAMEQGMEAIFLPAENAREASAIRGIQVYGVRTVSDLIAHLTGQKLLSPMPQLKMSQEDEQSALDFCHVKGQQAAKRGAVIAAAGFHNLLFIGSPGSGKSMIAKRMGTILPPMEFSEMLDTTRIHSVAGLTTDQSPLVTQRPFRSPHHSISFSGLAGGGSVPRPGEVSLAHNGILFLDELPEFAKNALEVLRQPLEDGTVTITRASGSMTYPCDFMLICAMNPCRCGYFGHPTRECTCPPGDIRRYISRISGPLLDRIDLHIEVPPVQFEDLASGAPDPCSSAVMREQVMIARQMQQERFAGTAIRFNSRIGSDMLDEFCPMDADVRELLRSAFTRLNLSARAYTKIVKVARTIADLNESKDIRKEHILEAIQYRTLDRKYWDR